MGERCRLCLVMGVAVAGACVAGCTSERELPSPSGPHYQYVVGDLAIPTSSVEARMNGLDLDGNGAVDNQLGMVFGMLHANGLGVGETATEALLRGGIIMLADVQTTSFETTDATGVTMFLGRDPDPDPCVDPARLETCGQHLLGTGVFAVEDASTSDLAVAPVIAGVFEAALDRLPIQIALDPNAPLRLDLHAARIRLTEIEPGRARGVLAGGVTTYDVDEVVLPEAAAQMTRILDAECEGSPDSSSCGCSTSRADLLAALFDTNHDCRIEASEVRASSLVQSLTEPDVMSGGEELLSFGVAVELVQASFDVPDPE